MALTESNAFNIGREAPNFSLPDTISAKVLSLKELKGPKGTVVMFICNHCPFVLHVNEFLVILANEFINKGIGFIAISANDIVNYPQDAPNLMKQMALKMSYPFPYLYDESQAVAKAYNAACTPDFYLFDKDLLAVYHGQLDNSRPGNGVPVTGKDLKLAIEILLAGGQALTEQKPSIGCGIKWIK